MACLGAAYPGITALAASLLLSGATLGAQADSVSVRDAWYRVPAAGVAVTAAYCRMENRGESAVTLVGFEALDGDGPRVELHESRTVVNDDGLEIVRMRALQSMDIPPGVTVTLAPGGKHIMVFAPPAAGDLTLRAAFADGSASDVRFERRDGAAR